MAIYNYKKISYPDGQSEVIVYEHPIRYDEDKEPVKRDHVYYKEMDGLEFNPNTGVIRSPMESERCKNSSLSRTKNKIYNLAHCNSWKYFVTFTFNPDFVNRYDYQECYDVLRLFLKNLWKSFPDFKYLIVPELHKDGAFHFHGFLSDCELKLVKHKDDIYNITNFKWGFSTVSIIKDTKAAATYICKYITKDLLAVSKGKRRYLSSQNLELPEEEKRYVLNLDKVLEGQGADYVKRVYSAQTDNTITYMHYNNKET